MNKQHIKGSKGFTLIELMATIAILALIVIIAVPSIGNIMASSKEKSEAASIAMIEKSGSTAELAGLEHDRPGQYDVGTLILSGYLDFDAEHELAGGYVAQVDAEKGNTYVYNGETAQADSDFVTGTIHDYLEESMRNVYESMGMTWNDFSEGNLREQIEILDASNIAIMDYVGPGGDVVIPDEIDGKKTLVIGKRAFADSGLTSIDIPDTLQMVDEFAFANNDLKTLNMPSSLNTIYTGIIENNPNMESITFNHTAEVIDVNLSDDLLGEYGTSHIFGNPYSANGKDPSLFNVYLPESLDGSPLMDVISGNSTYNIITGG